MIAVIKGDISASRKLKDQDLWLKPLELFLNQLGNTPVDWEIVWGDFFQLEVDNPEGALKIAFSIKALIKKVDPIDSTKKSSTLDVKMAIGVGKKSYSGKRISESNGSAFINASECFSALKQMNTNLAIKSPWPELDNEINLYLKLAGTFMDEWTLASAELVEIVLNNQRITQKEIGMMLGIKQNSVSGRWKRAHIDEILAVEKVYRQKVKKLFS